MMMKNDLLKIMLTVFKHNDIASSFFKDVLKYEIDETCPYDTVYEQFDYEILSRYHTWYTLRKLKIGVFLGLTQKRRIFETRIRRLKIAANLNQTGARAEADEVRILRH